MRRLEGRSEAPRARSGETVQPGAARPAAAAPTATWLRWWPRRPAPAGHLGPRRPCAPSACSSPSREPQERKEKFAAQRGPHRKKYCSRPARQVPLRSPGARRPKRGAGLGGGVGVRVCGRSLGGASVLCAGGLSNCKESWAWGRVLGWGRLLRGYSLTCGEGAGQGAGSG